MEGRKALIFSTLAAALMVFSIAAVGHFTRSYQPIVTASKGFPSFGKSSAPIEVVLVEDFQCKTCREFSQKMIPKLQEEYIRSGKVRFTLVPVSFLAGSQKMANAALEVYHQNPSQFFPYLKDLLSHEGEIKTSDLIRLARRRAGINLEKLQSCIEKGCHDQELEKNLDWARGIMGAQFRTPALYINGAPGSTYSFEAIQHQIDQILRKS